MHNISCLCLLPPTLSYTLCIAATICYPTYQAVTNNLYAVYKVKVAYNVANVAVLFQTVAWHNGDEHAL